MSMLDKISGHERAGAKAEEVADLERRTS